jgi:hypothetical protein
MCAALHSNTFLPAALNLLEQSRTQEEQMHYVSVLVNSAGSSGWNAELRGKLIKLAIERVPHWKGGASVRPYREWRMNSIIGMLSDDQRRQFADSIAKALTPPGIMPATSRNFVKHWKIEDFTAALEAGLKQPRNFNTRLHMNGVILLMTLLMENKLLEEHKQLPGSKQNFLTLSKAVIQPKILKNFMLKCLLSFTGLVAKPPTCLFRLWLENLGGKFLK